MFSVLKILLYTPQNEGKKKRSESEIIRVFIYILGRVIGSEQILTWSFRGAMFLSTKRKTSTKPVLSRKRPKVQHTLADSLPWKTVARPKSTGLSGDDGILALEEVDGVEVLYEGSVAGRVVKFHVGALHSDILTNLTALGQVTDKPRAGAEIHKESQHTPESDASEEDFEFDGRFLFQDYQR